MRTAFALTVALLTVGVPICISAEELPPLAVAGIDRMFADWDRPDAPGCAVGVVRDGKLVYAKGFGSANLDFEAPNSPQTLFELGSFSKAMTSACIALLLDDERIDRSDDVRQYVPELHPFDPPIRIEHLLTCHSGLWAQVHIMPLAGWDNMPIHSPYTRDDMLTILRSQRSLPFEPGSQFRYGSSDFFLLGLVVERVTGQTLAEFAREHLFEPLGMARTFYQVDPTLVVKNRAMPYHKLPDSRGPWHQWPINAYVAGGGGVWSSIEDLVQFDRNFSRNRLPDGECIREFFEQGSVLVNRFCLDVDAYRKKVDPELARREPPGIHRGLRRIQFTGGWFGMESAMARYPDEGVTIMCLSNNSEISPILLAGEIAERVLGDKLHPPHAEPDVPSGSRDQPELRPNDYEAVSGSYQMHEAGHIWQVFARQGKLFYTNHLKETFELRPGTGSRFEAVDTPYEGDFFVFEKSSAGQAYQFSLRSGARTIGFDRVTLASPTEADLEDFEGIYDGSELDATYSIALRAGTLWLRVNNRRWERLEPTLPDTFIAHDRHPHDNRVFSFERDQEGAVVGLSVDFWRIQDLKFKRQ